MSSSFKHVFTNEKFSPLKWLNNISLCIYYTFSLSIHSLTDLKLIPSLSYYEKEKEQSEETTYKLGQTLQAMPVIRYQYSEPCRKKIQLINGQRN
jgi:hypothetical protein